MKLWSCVGENSCRSTVRAWAAWGAGCIFSSKLARPSSLTRWNPENSSATFASHHRDRLFASMPKNVFFVRFECKLYRKIVVGGGFMTEELKTCDDKSESRGNCLLIKTLLSWNRKSRKFISEKLVAVSRVDKIREIFHFICHPLTWFIFNSAALSRALRCNVRGWPLVIASTPLSVAAIADAVVGGA